MAVPLERRLAEREMGADGGRCLVDCVQRRRLRSLQLSSSKRIERSHKFTGSGFCLDIEQSEQRYMLCGSTDGTLCVIDLSRCVPDAVGVVRRRDEAHTRRYGMVAVAKRSRDAHRLSNHGSLVVRATWYPHDTGMFASSSTDCRLLLWDTNTMKPVESYELSDSAGARPLNCHDWAPVAGVAPRLAAAGELPEVVLIDLRSGSTLHRLRSSCAGGVVNAVKWSPRREHCLCAGNALGALHVWDVRHTRAPAVRLCEPDRSQLASSVSCVRWSPDGTQVIATFGDGHVRAWRAWPGGRVPHVLPTHLRPSSRMTLPVKLSQFDAHFAHGGRLGQSTIFLPHSHDVHVMHCDERTAAGGTLAVLRAHFSWVNACAYRSWHQELYTVGSDKQIVCWSPQMDDDAFASATADERRHESHQWQCDEWSD